MASKFHVGNAILAEYVGLGHNNKHVLVNVYSGDVILRSLPTELSIGLYIEIIRTAQGLPEIFDLEIALAGKLIFRATAQKDPRNSETTVFMLPMAQFTATEEGEFTVHLMATGFAKTKALSKRFYVGAIPSSPSVSPPPSVQSRAPGQRKVKKR